MNIGVLASHEGTTLQAIIDACEQGRINGRVVAVVSNNSGSGALRRAAAAAIETFHLSSVTHSSGDSLDAAICRALQGTRADVIFLAGYMKRHCASGARPRPSGRHRRVPQGRVQACEREAVVKTLAAIASGELAVRLSVD
jgi:formyl transferase-like protein